MRLASCFLSLVIASSALAQSAISTDPHRGPPDDKITVSGSGFDASEVVDIYFDKTDLAAARADSDGAFSRALQVPGSAVPGKHTISTVGRTSGFSAQARFLVQTDWREFHHGPFRHGYNPKENVLGVSNVGQLQMLWSAAGNGLDSPVVADGVVYQASYYDTKLYAYDAATGKTLWSAYICTTPCDPTSNGWGSTPAVSQGVVYIGSGPVLYAFDARTGTQLWTAPLSGRLLYSSPAVSNGIVYETAGAYTLNGGLSAFDVVTGKTIWSVGLGEYTTASPAVADGIVYACGSVYEHGDFLYAFDAATGKQLWSVPECSYSSPLVANGMVYEATYNGVFAYDAATGRPVWKFPLVSPLSSPAFADQVLFVVAGRPSKLFALNAQTGTMIWSEPHKGYGFASPAIANGVVYLVSESKLIAFAAATGQQIWSGRLGSQTDSSAAIVNGMVYIAAAGKMYAFGLPPGSAAAQAVEPPAPPDPATLEPDLTLRVNGEE